MAPARAVPCCLSPPEPPPPLPLAFAATTGLDSVLISHLLLGEQPSIFPPSIFVESPRCRSPVLAPTLRLAISLSNGTTYALIRVTSLTFLLNH